MSTSAAGGARQTSQQGRETVAAQLVARGWSVREASIGRRPVLLIERDGVRRCGRVTAKRRGTWQTSTKYGAERAPTEAHGRFWIFVDLGRPAESVFVVPEDWMVEDIHARHQAYLDRHGGKRARSPESQHHGIRQERIEQWRDRWDMLDREPEP
jgi:hypothetical protein